MPRKRPRSFCQKCRWKVSPKHAYTLDPKKLEWADYAAVQAECWNLSGNELTRKSSGNIRSQSSQLAEPLWTDPDLKSRISLRELISTLKKKKAQAGNELSNILPKPSHARKKPPPVYNYRLHCIVVHCIVLHSMSCVALYCTACTILSCIAGILYLLLPKTEVSHVSPRSIARPRTQLL